jgi:hypothetical protein
MTSQAYFSAPADSTQHQPPFDLQSSQDANLAFFQRAPAQSPGSLSGSQKDFLKFEQQRAQTFEDARALRLEQLQSEND